jgi:hypothetical protein
MLAFDISIYASLSYFSQNRYCPSNDNQSSDVKEHSLRNLLSTQPLYVKEYLHEHRSQDNTPSLSLASKGNTEDNNSVPESLSQDTNLDKYMPKNSSESKLTTLLYSYPDVIRVSSVSLIKDNGSLRILDINDFYPSVEPKG